MVNEIRRQAALQQIQENITRHGHHVYIVAGAPNPRFAYTIGVSAAIGSELIIAGASFYLNDDVVAIVNEVVRKVKAAHILEPLNIDVPSLGTFSLRKAHGSWATALILGALDFYKLNEIQAYQIVPDKAHWTIDVPDLSEPWSPRSAPAWQWLHEPWSYEVPRTSMAATDLSALRGGRINEAVRWEEDEWELFAGEGPNFQDDDLRKVPLGTLLALDRSLAPVLSLEVTKGLWRDDSSDWHPWFKKETTESI